ncbi:unnamed protein product [Angiostrongylus costaricensis]|uniref:Uncharacterized protein n=1 Tax=Angiostrongylus costaricensis TaxID=334426 RepID=A0A0R3PS65_ANGCS|nr:unnamed protein product [Angiostrongylus costaricensis]
MAINAKLAASGVQSARPEDDDDVDDDDDDDDDDDEGDDDDDDGGGDRPAHRAEWAPPLLRRYLVAFDPALSPQNWLSQRCFQSPFRRAPTATF